MIPAWAYSLVSATAAVTAEAYFRANPGKTWPVEVWPALILGLIVNWGIWGLSRTQTLIGIAILFSAMTVTLRTVITLVQGDHVAPGAWAGLVLLLAATIVKGVWK